MSGHSGRRRAGNLAGASLVFVLVVLLSASVPAAGSVYDYVYANNTAAVQTPSVVLQAGNTGTSSVSQSTYATATVTAGLDFYENAAPSSTCTSPSADTILNSLPSPNSVPLSRGTTYCLWSTQFTSGSTLYALNWVTDLWLDASATGYGIGVAMYVTDSTGAVQGSAIFSGTTSTISTKNLLTELKDTFPGVAASIPTNGYLELTLTPPTGGGTPHGWDIYWGTGQLTNFLTPSNYNYVLSINNGAAVGWTVNLAAASSSNLGRLLNFTISLATAPVSKQVLIASGSVTQTSGTAVTLPASSTLNIAVGGTASAIPALSNSVITVSLKLLSSSTVYSQYTVTLYVN